MGRTGRTGGTGWDGVYKDFLLDATDDRQNVGFGCMKAFSKGHVPMKYEKKQNVLLEKLTLADARKRIEEFRYLKPIEGKSGAVPAPPPIKSKGSSPKGKR